MKNLILSIIILSALAFGCKKKTEGTTTGYSFEINTSKQIDEANLILTKINDSRCTSSAFCIGPSSTQTYFKLKSGNTEQEIILCKGDCGTIGATAKLKINGVNYVIKLIEVSFREENTAQTVKVELTRF
ncbi:hypothetical protein ASE74_18615 [Pedobacter sp. Leaf216]|uniref:hypothetical protein n=1 Tax=Pedobacter sp. Leaf216 TaxID=1735684 RepID=UPI0006F8CFBA|nr:hypothetical protein [Pedobacter sp. Leaf216]KQM77257.1 hypothetical protein ASE74_18615 [Pedobacter sp. Leaf216]